jgi:ABC-2 type transport system permease protein
MNAVLGSIFRAELKLLSRNVAVAVAATVLPLAVAAYLVYTGKSSPHAIGWAVPITLILLLLFGMTGYMTSAGSLSARRDDLYLKRLRCGEASDSVVLLGVLSPVIVVTLAQCLLVLVVTAIAGPAVPTNPVLLVAVLLAGTVLAVTAGMATSGVTTSSEQAQTAAMPFFLVLLGSGVWASFDIAEGLSTPQRLLPGGAVLDLVRLSYDTSGTFVGQLADGLPALGVLAAWVLIGVLVGKRYFRWEPRSH